MRILLDADALIKLTRAGAKELMVGTFDIHVPEPVAKEVVEEGKALGHADAVVVEENVRRALIRVVPEPDHQPAAAAMFSAGDRSIVALSMTSGYAAVVTDDGYLLEQLKGLGVSATVPAALLVAIGRRRQLPADEVLQLLEGLRPFISDQEFVTSRLIVEGRYPRK